MVGRCIPYSNGRFLGDMLVFRGVMKKDLGEDESILTRKYSSQKFRQLVGPSFYPPEDGIVSLEPPNHQKFQVPKMEGFPNLMFGYFGGWVFP